MLFISLLVLVVVPITNFFHETGHIFIAKLFNLKGSDIVIGTGPKLISFNLLETNVQFNLFYFLGGYSTNVSEGEITNWQRGLISLGGPLINIMVASLLLISNLPYSMLVELFILFNLWVGLVNLVPYKFLNRESDGFVFLTSIYKEIKLIRMK